MSFRSALRILDRDARHRAFDLLRGLKRESPSAKRMVENLFLETRIADSEWRELCRLLASDALTIEEAQTEILSFCRAGRQLMGDEAVLEEGAVLGRAVGREKYCSMLHEECCLPTFEAARSAVRRLEDRPVRKIPATWKNWPLGRYVMWGVFDAGHLTKPFPRRLPELSVILCKLGLEPDEILTPDDRTALLFAYCLPETRVPHIPTFGDAYASWPWHRSFRSAPATMQTGMTQPPDSCSDITGLPEVVHKPITLDQLVRKVRFAR